MNGRSELLLEVRSKFIDHKDESVRAWAVRNALFEYLNLLSDETLRSIAEKIEHPTYGSYTAVRLSMLLASRQHRGLERVIRNILLFADIETSYRASLKVGINGWRVLHPVESKSREFVCGKHVVIESAEEAIAMKAVFHGYMALITHYLRTNSYEALGRYSSPWAWLKINEMDTEPMLRFFASHPDQAMALHEYVAERGLADPEVLSLVSDSQSALSIGVL